MTRPWRRVRSEGERPRLLRWDLRVARGGWQRLVFLRGLLD